jgi:hypothetical protein
VLIGPMSPATRPGGRPRRQAGRAACPSVVIMDGQSVKTTERGGIRGFDAHKRVKGRKCHILVDTFGLLIACRFVRFGLTLFALSPRVCFWRRAAISYASIRDFGGCNVTPFAQEKVDGSTLLNPQRVKSSCAEVGSVIAGS